MNPTHSAMVDWIAAAPQEEGFWTLFRERLPEIAKCFERLKEDDSLRCVVLSLDERTAVEALPGFAESGIWFEQRSAPCYEPGDFVFVKPGSTWYTKYPWCEAEGAKSLAVYEAPCSAPVCYQVVQVQRRRSLDNEESWSAFFLALELKKAEEPLRPAILRYIHADSVMPYPFRKGHVVAIKPEFLDQYPTRSSSGLYRVREVLTKDRLTVIETGAEKPPVDGVPTIGSAPAIFANPFHLH